MKRSILKWEHSEPCFSSIAPLLQWKKWNIWSFDATEDQLFQNMHPGLSVIAGVVASDKHPFLIAKSLFLATRPHGLHLFREVRISLNLRWFLELFVLFLYLLSGFCIHYIFTFCVRMTLSHWLSCSWHVVAMPIYFAGIKIAKQKDWTWPCCLNCWMLSKTIISLKDSTL